jgi:hypothetical protein
LNKKAWKESGATTCEEFFNWYFEKLQKFKEDVEASGLSDGEYVLAIKIAQEKAQTHA